MSPVRDDLNPKFVFFSPVRPGDSVEEHVAHAIKTWCATPFELGDRAAVEILNPVTVAGTMRIDLWVEEMDESSCTYAFLCSSEDGCTPYARGERTVTKLDPRLRRTNAGLLRDLHAFA